MKNLSSNSLLLWGGISLLACAIQTAIMHPLTSLSIDQLLLDGLISGLLLATLCFLLQEIIRYGKLNTLPFVQKTINHCALAIIFTVVLIGGNLCILHLILPETNISTILLPTIPTRITITLLVYALMSVCYEYELYKQSLNTEPTINDSDDNEYDNEVLVTPDINDTNEIEVTTEPEILEHIAVKNGQKIDLIYVNDIIYIQAEGDYVMIHSTNGKFLKEETMKYLNQHLPPNKFVRVHRSSIINIDYIQRIELYEKQNQILKLHNNLQVKISITGYKELKKILNL